MALRTNFLWHAMLVAPPAFVVVPGSRDLAVFIRRRGNLSRRFAARGHRHPDHHNRAPREHIAKRHQDTPFKGNQYESEPTSTNSRVSASFTLNSGVFTGDLNNTYSTRRTSSDITIAPITPPITTVASGRCTSAPIPVLNAIGKKPRLATKVVINTGRSRVVAASITA